MNIEKYKQITEQVETGHARLIAVSKTQPIESILKLYQAGQRLFGENKVQELTEKQALLPADIQWHLIGHLQSNKVKYIAPFISLIHSVDSLKLLREIDKEAKKNNRVIDCLLQLYIAKEETKFGLLLPEAVAILQSKEYTALKNVRICGVMGMATNTASEETVQQEFAHLASIYNTIKQDYFKNSAYFNEISMGMSADYKLALQAGSTLIRVGSLLFS